MIQYTLTIPNTIRTAKRFLLLWWYGSGRSLQELLPAGDAELDDLLTMIFNKQTEVSEFVGKLYRWFCYYTIDAARKPILIKPLAQLFRNSNWEIKPVLAALFKSEHFDH